MAKTSPTQQQIIRAAASSRGWESSLAKDLVVTLNELSDDNSSKVIVLLFIGSEHELVRERITELRVSKSAKFKLINLFSQLFPRSTNVVDRNDCTCAHTDYTDY